MSRRLSCEAILIGRLLQELVGPSSFAAWLECCPALPCPALPCPALPCPALPVVLPACCVLCTMLRLVHCVTSMSYTEWTQASEVKDSCNGHLSNGTIAHCSLFVAMQSSAALTLVASHQKKKPVSACSNSCICSAWVHQGVPSTAQVWYSSEASSRRHKHIQTLDIACTSHS